MFFRGCCILQQPLFSASKTTLSIIAIYVGFIQFFGQVFFEDSQCGGRINIRKEGYSQQQPQDTAPEENTGENKEAQHRNSLYQDHTDGGKRI